jgi:hypothetical protein
MKRPRISEKAEQQAIVDLLRLIGAKVYVIGRTPPRDGRTHFGTGQTPGIGDLYAFVPRPDRSPFKPWIVLWVEVKRVGGRTRAEQLEFETLCDKAQHHYFRGTADGFTAYLRGLGFRIG